jgi:hypothetical protein
MKDVGKYFWTFGLFSCNLEYFMPIWYILWLFWYISPVLVCCTKKNLATPDRDSDALVDKLI